MNSLVKFNKIYLINFFKFKHSSHKYFLGDLTGGVPPVPISNTEVKPSRADDTAAVRLWESRSLPRLNKKSPEIFHLWAFLFHKFPIKLNSFGKHSVGDATHHTCYQRWVWY